MNVDNPIDTKRLVRISFYPSKIDLGHPFSRWYSSHSQSWVVHDIAKNQHYRWFINYEALSTSITHYQLYDYPLPAITFTSIFQSKIDLVHPNYPLLTLLLGECQKTQGHVFFTNASSPLGWSKEMMPLLHCFYLGCVWLIAGWGWFQVENPK